MKRTKITLLLLGFLFAQEAIVDQHGIYIVCEKMPEIEGGIKAIRVNCFLYFELSISLKDQMLPQRKNKIIEKYIWPK